MAILVLLVLGTYWRRGASALPQWSKWAWWRTEPSRAPSPRVLPSPALKTNLPATTNLAHTVIPELTPRANRVTNALSATNSVDSEMLHPVRNLLDAQIALARLGISSGCIDGSAGPQSRRALQAFQSLNKGLPLSGELDAETKAKLTIEEPVFTDYTITSEDLARLHPISPSWLGKSEQESLDYETILELVAEKGQASQPLIRSLNPSVNWNKISAGTTVKIPRIERRTPSERAAFVRISLLQKTLEAFDANTNLLAHFPCSIAQKVEKRPVGTLYVAKLAPHPNYVFDPAVFPESEEAQQIGRKLVLPPGPNNPVGTAWIGLDKPGYGIHGSPKPEQVGRTESHGCFRLANWNAEYLLDLVWVGMPVYVQH